MPLQLSTVIDAARHRHPAFHKSRAPSRVVGDFLSDYQNELIQKALQRDRQYCAQKAMVVLAFGTSDPSSVGAGTGDGLPGRPTAGGGFGTTTAPIGNLIDAVVDPDLGAQELVAETPVSSAAAMTLTKTAAGWTVNAFTNAVVVIVGGTGIGQRREIASNTATQLTITQAWATIPDTTSLFQVVNPVYGSGEDLSVVTNLPTYETTYGYLVKISATGTPFIDLTAPLVTSMEIGTELPANQGILHGTVLYNDGDRDDLTFVSESHRYNPPHWPAAFTLGSTLMLCGSKADWLDVVSLEIRYAPIAPRFATMSDYFLVPDAAAPCLTAAAAAFMALRVAELAEVKCDPAPHVARATDAEATYLSSLRLTRSTRRIRFRQGEY